MVWWRFYTTKIIAIKKCVFFLALTPIRVQKLPFFIRARASWGLRQVFSVARCQIVVAKNFLLLFNNYWTLHFLSCWNQMLFWLTLPLFFHIIIIQLENEIQGIQSDVSDLNKQQVRTIIYTHCFVGHF